MPPDPQSPLTYLVGPEFSLGYSAVLFTIFLIFLLRLFWKYRRLLKDVRAAHDSLESIGDPETFWTQYQRIDEALCKNRSLGHAWSEFTEAFVFPDLSDDEQAVRNSKEPSEQFDIGTIVEPHINIRGYNAIPNYLTGGGILGTFIGLAAGIYLAEPYLASSGDINATSQGLEFLLSGASLAFTTSITGLITSILFLFTERSLLSKLSSAIGDWNASLDSVLILATPGKVAIHQLRELRQQTNQLKKFNTELATSIAAALDEKIAGRIAPDLSRLVETMEGLRSDKRATSEGMIEQVVEELKKSLTGAAGSEMSALAGTLEQLNETLTSSVKGLERNEQAMATSFDESRAAMSAALDESLKRLSEEMSEATQRLTGRLEESAETMSDQLRNSSSDAAERFASALSAFSSASTQELDSFVTRVSSSGDEMTRAFRKASDDAAAAVAQSADQVHEQTQQAQALLEEIKRATASLRGVIEQVRETGTGLSNLGPRLDEAAQTFGTASQKIASSTSSMDLMSRRAAQSAESLMETQKALREAWEGHLSRFEHADEAMQRVFGEIDTGLERFMERVSKHNREFDSAMSDAVGLLGGAIRELGDTLEDSIDALNGRQGSA